MNETVNLMSRMHNAHTLTHPLFSSICLSICQTIFTRHSGRSIKSANLTAIFSHSRFISCESALFLSLSFIHSFISIVTMAHVCQLKIKCHTGAITYSHTPLSIVHVAATAANIVAVIALNGVD